MIPNSYFKIEIFVIRTQYTIVTDMQERVNEHCVYESVDDSSLLSSVTYRITMETRIHALRLKG